MQHSICSLIGYEIRATDGDLGTVDEFYFDDETWTVRYFVVETGNWLSGSTGCSFLLLPSANPTRSHARFR